jgi:hypothetical protein
LASIPGADDQQRLVKDLFQGYNKLIRPGQINDKTVVTFAINLAVIIFVVSKKISLKKIVEQLGRNLIVPMV